MYNSPNISTCWQVDWLKSLTLITKPLLFRSHSKASFDLQTEVYSRCSSTTHSIQTQLLFKRMSNCTSLAFQTMPKDKRRPSAHSNVKGKFRWTLWKRGRWATCDEASVYSHCVGKDHYPHLPRELLQGKCARFI